MSDATTTPIVCDMSGAPDTAEERMAEWARLFAAAYVGRERTAGGVRWRLRAGDGIEEWVRDLAVREKACCPFLDLTVTTIGGEVRWDISFAPGAVVDEDMTRTIMDEFYGMPDVIGDGIPGMERRMGDQGVAVSRDPAGSVMTFRARTT
jgi:hypothetical protein